MSAIEHARPTHPAATAGRLIAIASGKGGVGKTWFAITLAHALARGGDRAVLFDCDLGLANVDIQLGLMPTHDIGSVLSGSDHLADAIIQHDGAFDILAGRSGSGDLAASGAVQAERLRQIVHALRHRYATVILDLGAGLDPFVRQMACMADLLLIVATDEPTSLTDAYAVLKLYQRDLGKRPAAARIVINQAGSHAAGTRTYTTLAKAAQSFLGLTPPLAGVIRRDDKVRDAIRRQTLLLTRHPGSEAAADVTALAQTL
jgi:flagellar biosynthesis protein FlhG